ncbi:MAG: CehA/McbA family metallohydrolase [Verrucomicrobia bacterium]|nr:CehA/McbA family metallohydrolase [Verrucomicrobiota bacterium]
MKSWPGLLVPFTLAAVIGARAHELTRPPLILAQAPPPGVAATPAGPTAPLTIELTVGDTSEIVAGLVRITEINGGRAVDLPAHLRRGMNWFSLAAGATVNVPLGAVKIEACHGLETEVTTLTHTIAATPASNRVRVPLRRFYHIAARGLAAGNTHLHLYLNSPLGRGGALLRSRREAEDYLAAIGQSDALDLVYVSHLERPGDTQNYISNEFTRADLARLSTARVRFGHGEEHRHEGGRSGRRGGQDELRYGHVMLLDLPRLVQPVSYGAIFTRGGSKSDAMPMRRVISEARSLDATVIWCHGRQGLEDVPNWVAGLLDAQNIFDGGSDGTPDTTFYPYLNAGLRVPFSTGTDWGCYDFSRVYVKLDAPATSRSFLRGLTQGRSFITNGPLLEFDVEGKSAGDTLDLPARRAVKIRARVLGRDEFGRAELVFNGTVIARTDPRKVGGHFAAHLDTSVEITEPGWLALRVPATMPYTDSARYAGTGANLLGKALFAHTSPVYVNLAGKSICQPAAVRTLVADLETSIATIEAKGAFASDAERTSLVAIYRAAITTLQSRL